MNDEDIDSNIEWDQSKKFSKNTRISRRIDQEKVDLADNLNKNNFKNITKPIKKITPNLKKIQNKIRDVYDDEDDEDEDGKSTIILDFDFDFDNSQSSLYGVLSEEEKTHLAAVKNIENMGMQQVAGKNADIMRADQMSKDIGLNGLNKKIISDTTQDVTFSDKTFEQTLIKDISKKTKFKTDNLSSEESSQMIEGLNKMKQANLLPKDKNLETLSKNMTTQDLIEIGKEDNDKKAAKIILEKSGRKENKKATEQNKKAKKEKLKKIENSLKKIKTR